MGLPARGYRVNGGATCQMSGAIVSVVGLPFRSYSVNGGAACQVSGAMGSMEGLVGWASRAMG